jgi:hypothetical protein
MNGIIPVGMVRLKCLGGIKKNEITGRKLKKNKSFPPLKICLSEISGQAETIEKLQLNRFF